MMSDYRQSSIFLRAPAKINIYFELLGKRDDGYHQVETLMAPIALADSLLIRSRLDSQIHLRVEHGVGPRAHFIGHAPEDQRNLVMRAAELLRNSRGSRLGCDVVLRKNIPSEAGLGGGSSDAAATLLGLNQLWRLGCSFEELSALANQLGSDVPFFLQSGPAVCTERGERVRPIQGGFNLPLVLVKPAAGLSTRQVYGLCRPPKPWPTERLTKLSQLPSTLAGLRPYFFNRLQEAAREMAPWLEGMESAFQKVGALLHQLTGSGSAYYGLFATHAEARKAAARLKGMNIGWVVNSAMGCLKASR